MKNSSIMSIYCKDVRALVPKQQIEKHLKFVIFVVSKLCKSSPSYQNFKEDLIQAGNLGLIEAVKKFDPVKGTFTTYAKYWIKNSIQRETHFLRNAAKIGIERLIIFKEEPLKYTSLDDPNTSSSIQISSKTDIEYDFFKEQVLEELNKTLFEVLDVSERELINLRFYKDMSLAEIGNEINLSKQRIHQVQTQILSKLKSDPKIQRIYKMFMDLQAA